MTTHSEIDEMVTNPITTGDTSTFFGEVITLDFSAWKLVKGRGRAMFDPTYDDPADKRRAITLVIECQKRDGGVFQIDTGRQPLLEIDPAWRRHLLPSIQKLGVSLSTLTGKFVQVRRVETGETYTNSSGELKAKTALELLAVYDTREAMQAARQARFGGASSAVPVVPSAPPAAPSVDSAALQKLIPALWAASGQNQDVFRTMFQANPVLAQAFTYEQALEIALLPF